MILPSDKDHIFSDYAIKSITKIQSVWRGYRVRRNLLSNETYKIAKKFVDQCPDISLIPKANTGITRVYFPDNIPVALKALGIPRSKNRFLTMWKARDICKKNGYKHLLIPKAFPYKEFNIEEKLPIIDVKQREQIALYEENKEIFSPAVIEFTGFLCQTIFPDILTYSHPYQKKNQIPLARYDNVPLLLDGDNGKVVLIDLGGFKLRSNKISLSDALEIAQTAIYIFPYHFKEILTVMIDYQSEIVANILDLEVLSKKVIISFESIYKIHCTFVQNKISNTKQSLLTFKQPSIENIFKRIVYDFLNLKKEHKKNIFLTNDFFEHFRNSIVNPIIEKSSQEIALYDPFYLTICKRALTINCDEISIFKNVHGISEKIAFLQKFLDELVLLKEICYANLYYGRSDQLHIKIHY